VLAPGDPEECFHGSVLATNLAQRAQCPVILALDAVCHDSFTVPRFDLDRVSIDQGKRVSQSEVAQMEEYRRYEITEDGISPWAVPGTRDAMNLVTGNERNEWGRVTTEPDMRIAMVNKRSRKIETVRPHLPKAVEWGERNSPVGILAVGILGGVIAEAAERLAEQEYLFHCHRPRTLWPVLEDTIDFVNSHQRVYVVEQSEGAQLAGLLKSEGARADKIVSILKYDGLQFSTAELVKEIVEKERQA
jgi:2-oxoglutarate ferredoxin oxidoreductase subunit alpha